MIRALVVAVVVSGLGCSNPARPCTSASCTGCCDSAGQCQRGDTSVACGSSASACVSCGLTGSCLAGACVPVSGSGGGQAGGGLAGGGSAAGGTAGGLVDAGLADAGFVMDAGAVTDGGAPDAGARFTLIDLDQTARGDSTLALAVHRASGRIGVAYFAAKGTQTMAGVDDYDVKYVEVQNGVVASPQVVRTVQRRAGIALVFDGTGQPIISYLGGAPGFEPGGAVFWFQSDAVIARRTPAWTETVLVTGGDVVTCGNPVSDRGFLVGVFPTMAFDGTGKLHLAYRDPHSAQFPMADFAGSDVEVVEDVIGTRSFQCVKPGGSDKGGWGGHLDMAIGPGLEPVLVHDKQFGGVAGTGQDVVFQRRQSTGTWTAPVTVATMSNTMSGPSVAGHSTVGVAFAVVDATVNQLQYWSNADSMVASTAWQRENVLSTGSSGWYPSLAFSSAGVPSIAHYQCSSRSSVPDGDCRQSEDDLRLATRTGPTWTFESIDASGGVGPKLAFTSGDKRVIAYRVPGARRADTSVEPTAGALKLAIER